ncbi:MAG: ArsA family ATPase [Nannocystis sp.]|nr:ArsA family ATPase [Nannocystis sp.]MBA3545376.1 ArsA family ATPase [Nannocystis sp.]
MDPSRSPESVLDDLAARQLLIVSGKGGVGRTTVAALLGIALARRGRRVLVATVGPDDRLAWMLGQRSLSESPVAARPGLFIQRVVPHVCIREYGGLVLHSDRIAAAVLDNGPMRRLLRTIPGLDDFAILGKVWHEAVRDNNVDAVVFDGPATGHLRYCLGIPQAILRTLTVGPLPREARLMQDSLEDPRSVQSVLVGLPDRWPLSELGEMAAALREELHVGVGAVVVNGLWPAGLPELGAVDPDPEQDPDGAVARVFAATTVVARQARRQREGVTAWLESERAAGRAGAPVLALPWHWQGFTGVGDLEQVLAGLERPDLSAR